MGAMKITMLLLAFVAPQDDGARKVLWTLDTDSTSYGSGAVGDIDGDGKPEIVFGTYFNDEHLYAVNAEDGTVLWKHKSNGGPMDASVAIVDIDGDGKLEVLSADSASGLLYCLSGEGKLLWTIQLPSGTDSPPAVADLDGDGTLEIVVGSMWRPKGGGGVNPGQVTVYRADTQKVVWQKEVEGCVQSAPCLVDLNEDKTLDVIVTSWRGTNAVHAFSGVDGKELWTFETMDEDDRKKDHMGLYHGVSAGVLKKGGELRLVFGTCSTRRGTLFVIDAKGKEVWKKRIGEYLFAPTAIVDLTGDGDREIIVSGRNTYAYSADGKELWKVAASTNRGPAIADVDGDGDQDVVLGTTGRKVLALDGPTGKTLWSHDVTVNGNVYEKIGAAPLIADFDGDGVLDVFIVTGKGTSDKTKHENFGRALVIQAGSGKGSWTTFRGNLRRTGTRK